MTLINTNQAAIGAVLLLLANQLTAHKPSDLTAVLTQIEGQVTLSSERRSEFRSVRRAVQRQIIRRGEVIHVPSGAQVAVICSTEMLVRLTGPRDWMLDATACEGGIRLPGSAYRNSALYAGRILSRDGSLLLELEPRDVEMGVGPILLSPRNTALIETRPRIVWTRVPEAFEYEIVLRGPVGTSIQLAAEGLRCGRGSGPWHDLDVCSWTPSSNWPALEPGMPVTVRLGSRQASTASFRRVREVSETYLLPVDDQSRVQEELRQIASLPMDKASQLLLTAGTYAQNGLYADAILAYYDALQAQEVPEARVTLGDLYLTIGLTALADREYRQVLADAPDPAVQAAALLGRGQVAYLRNAFDDARVCFEHARELYAASGLPAEAEIARLAVARFQARRRLDSPPKD